LLANQSYAEISETTTIIPGKSFWLMVKDAGKIIDTGAGKSTVTSRSFAVPLPPGWNFVADPFNFPIPLQNLRLHSGLPVDLRSYTGSWNDTASTKVTMVQPFEGYALCNNTTAPDTLFVNPDLSSTANTLLKDVTAAVPAKARWSIHILAQCQEARDVDNYVALVPSSSHGYDAWDRPEPPVVGEYVSVYFPHRDWKPPSPGYCVDARPEFSDGEIWALEVTTNIRDKVNLAFAGIAEIPNEFEIWIIDEALQLLQNLREVNHYTVAGSAHPKKLKLVVGKSSFVDEKLATVQALPTAHELSQNFPNPFNPATTIRYGLPKAERVTLIVYNLLGKEVARLVDNEQNPAGYHAVIWDGRNRNGDPVASGVYVYRLRAGSVVISTKKLTLMK
jgi:hypothetical protein